MTLEKAQKFIKHEIVLTVASVLAIVSMFFVKPGKEYAGYIDFPVLAILFCLMIVIAGFIKLNLFDVISDKVIKATGSIKIVLIILVSVCFFCAMFVTNDVALITFVPFTAGLFGKKHQDELIFVIVMETIAANLGSMLTPIGNPHNLYLFSHYNMSMLDFFKVTLPLCVLSYIMIMLVMVVRKSKNIDLKENAIIKVGNIYHLAVYSLIFAACVLTVLRLIDYKICLLITVILILITDSKLFKKVDYSLLLTFVAFFIFVGNMSNVGIIKDLISKLIYDKELFSGIVLSQVISNVPASIMLSGFTEKWKPLLIGVNIGGLGTLVASLASLISYKLYVKSENSNPKKFLFVFSIYNFVFLIILTAVYCMVGFLSK